MLDVFDSLEEGIDAIVATYSRAERGPTDEGGSFQVHLQSIVHKAVLVADAPLVGKLDAINEGRALVGRDLDVGAVRPRQRVLIPGAVDVGAKG